MLRRFIGLLLTALTLAAPLGAQTAGCPPARTALVLSGGGAKGLAHIGVLRVLDSLGIRPDLVVGSSMGAIIGAMYASGYTGRQIDSLARALPISALFRSWEPQAPRAFGPVRPLVVWEQGERGFALQSAAVREAEANALLNAAMLRGNLLARGDFDSLPIPFRAVATDLADRSIVVLDGGDLARAVRASIAIPLIFAPVEIDGRVLADGGLAANIPIAVARKLGATRLIVSDATERQRDSVDLYSPLVLAGRLLGFLFEQPGDTLAPGDVGVRPAVDGFTSLNFSPRVVARLIGHGTVAADTVLPRAECLPHGAARVGPLPVRLADVAVDAGSGLEQRTIRRLLGVFRDDSVDAGLLRSRLRDLGESERYRAVWLEPAPGPTPESVRFEVTVRRAPRRVAAVGLAYDNELGGRAWGGLVDRNLVGLGVEGSGALYLGELRREAVLGVRWSYEVLRRVVQPRLELRGGTESVRRFAPGGTELSEARTEQLVGFAGVERTMGRGWIASGGAVARVWSEPGRSADAAGLVVRLAKSGRGAEQLVGAEAEATGLYLRAAFDARATVRLGAVHLRPGLRVGWGDDLPLQLTFPLGGEDGFPGRHIGEVRGDRELMGDLLLTVPLRGPLVARAEVAAGRAALGGPLVDSDGWIAGGRLGLGAETPVGPIRVEYGRSTGDREALFVRIGSWF